MHRRSDKTLDDLARMTNPYIRGWINYYGHFYKSALYWTLNRVDAVLVRWACDKFKRLPEAKACKGMAGTGSPGESKPLRALALCACRRLNIGSRMTREGHVRF